MLFARRKRSINRILVVEDEALVAFDNEYSLQDAGYEIVATVDSVPDALRVIAGGGLDLVLSDVQLSRGGSGVAVAEAAKAAGIPVLFVTANCPVEARSLAIGCLGKPYSPRELRAAIDAVDDLVSGRTPGKPPAGLSLYGEG